MQGALKTTISLQDIITGKGNPAVDVIITTIAYIIYTNTRYCNETKEWQEQVSMNTIFPSELQMPINAYIIST